ncbi:MAG: hypothetical protein AUH30_01810 [Candidatus Rokubacteria bacterium 13_1_40CM_68_15]|nr:MAG: hypothetical protein AUH30_01810 [Candidatus Rokubacteria bacterium 13_1_40CM_68_15]
MLKKIYVVSKAKPELHERLSTYFAADETTKVILDRRRGECRGPETAAPGRRRRDVSGDLENRGWAMVELNGSNESSTDAPVLADVARIMAVIEGRTPAAVAALGAQPHPIVHFPYAIERCGEVGGRALVLDRRLGLPDREPFRVSRRHCVLVRDKQGLSVVDAMSRLGTVVNGVRIGGGSGRRRATLNPGANEIAVGGPGTPYIFNLVLRAAAV